MPCIQCEPCFENRNCIYAQRKELRGKHTEMFTVVTHSLGGRGYCRSLFYFYFLKRFSNVLQ